jgi:tetratricopeptide (TPR) repeat protein
LESLKIVHEVGDRVGESSSLGNLGFSAGLLGDFAAARTYHTRSLQIAREVGNRFQQVYTLINLSSLAGLQDDASTALRSAAEAADLARETAEPSGEAWAMLYMGHAWSMQGEYELARTAYQKSIEIRRRLDQPISGLVEIAMAVNDLDAAEQDAESIIRFVHTNPTLEGTDEPLRVYHACYRYLEMKKDPRSAQLLQQARQLLETQVSKFKSESERRRYIENIPWRRAIWGAG